MTRDEIVKIAWDVGLFMRSHQFQDEPTKLERFAERIAAHEREECAKVCEETRFPDSYTAIRCAEAIRARGEV